MSRQQQAIRAACLWLICVFAYRAQAVCTTQDGRLSEGISVNVPHYVGMHLLIRRKGDHPDIGHLSFPSTTVTLFKPIFQKAFLHKVLDLHNEIKHMRVWSGSRYVTLMDMCYRQTNVSKKCVTPSLLEYYQAVHKNIDKQKMDYYNFFIEADYLDHFLSCARNPAAANDGTRLNMSCISTYNQPVPAPTVLCGYTGDQFDRSTHLILTYIFRDPKLSKTSRKWTKGLRTMLKSAITQDMDIHVYESGSGYTRGPLKL
ncbi:NPC intracellular cholesterol transporter 1-like isoform X1 [Haliotis asinina]|uniref:NPC intracellular cholesterol transporter 1-like isoform X1 n=1 Tax=Haliotis asinina TaxID=109174 RepID=UPI00353227A7